MLEQISNLFKDANLQKKLTGARSKEEAVGLVVGAGAEKGLSFSADDLKRLLGVFATPKRSELSEAELASVAGGRMMASDGTHVHMSCCTDCPKSAALCCK